MALAKVVLEGSQRDPGCRFRVILISVPLRNTEIRGVHMKPSGGNLKNYIPYTHGGSSRSVQPQFKNRSYLYTRWSQIQRSEHRWLLHKRSAPILEAQQSRSIDVPLKFKDLLFY